MSEVGDLLDEFDDGRVHTPLGDIRPSEIIEGKVEDLLSSGVYVLVFNETVIYVGQAKVLLQRVYAHFCSMVRVSKGLPPAKGTKGFTFTKIRIYPCSPHKLNSLERTLIARYRPQYNTQLVEPLLGKRLTLAQMGFRVDRLIPPQPKVIGIKRRF